MSHANENSLSLFNSNRSFVLSQKVPGFFSYFLAHVHTTVDTLMSIGGPVMHNDQIKLILEALPFEFDSIVVVVNSKSKFISLDELESLFITQDSRVAKSKKDVIVVLTVKLTRGGVQVVNSNYKNPENPDSNSGNSHGFGHESYFRGRGTRGGRFRGCGARNANRNSVQCKSYYKIGHDAGYCYYRHTHDPYGSNTC